MHDITHQIESACYYTSTKEKGDCYCASTKEEVNYKFLLVENANIFYFIKAFRYEHINYLYCICFIQIRCVFQFIHILSALRFYNILLQPFNLTCEYLLHLSFKSTLHFNLTYKFLFSFSLVIRLHVFTASIFYLIYEIAVLYYS